MNSFLGFTVDYLFDLPVNWINYKNIFVVIFLSSYGLSMDAFTGYILVLLFSKIFTLVQVFKILFEILFSHLP